MRERKDPEPDPDPYLSLVDPDPGGSKTCGSGSPTLVFIDRGQQIPELFFALPVSRMRQFSTILYCNFEK
jgi:hypothetical protein